MEAHNADRSPDHPNGGSVGARGSGASGYGFVVKERETIHPMAPLSATSMKRERAVLDSAPARDLFDVADDGEERLDEWRRRWLRDGPSWWGTRLHLPAYLGRMELLEDNAGGLWLRPVGQGIVIEALPLGDFVSDARLYGDEWEPRDCRPQVYPASWLTSAPVVARWSDDPAALELAPPELLGKGAREYLATTCPACDVVSIPGTCCSVPGTAPVERAP